MHRYLQNNICYFRSPISQRSDLFSNLQKPYWPPCPIVIGCNYEEDNLKQVRKWNCEDRYIENKLDALLMFIVCQTERSKLVTFWLVSQKEREVRSHKLSESERRVARNSQNLRGGLPPKRDFNCEWNYEQQVLKNISKLLESERKRLHYILAVICHNINIFDEKPLIWA